MVLWPKVSLYLRILAVILSTSHFLGSRNSLPPLQKGHTPSLGYWGLARHPQKSPRPFFPDDRIIQICLNSGETSRNSPNHTWINWRPIRDFCSRGARVAPWYTSEGLLGGLKQEQRSNYPKNWNCHGRPQCTRCKSKKSGFRLKLRIKKLSPRTIWQKSQKEFFYLWLNCNRKTVHLDWLQDCPIGFAKGTLQKLNFKINHKNWVFGLKKSLLSVVLMKKGPHNNLFSYCEGFPKNSVRFLLKSMYMLKIVNFMVLSLKLEKFHQFCLFFMNFMKLAMLWNGWWMEFGMKYLIFKEKRF